MVSIDFVLRTCAQSTVVKVEISNHLGSRNRLIHFTLIPMGKIVSVYEHFGLRTFRFTNDLQERIKFVNRGLTLYECSCKQSYVTVTLMMWIFCNIVSKVNIIYVQPQGQPSPSNEKFLGMRLISCTVGSCFAMVLFTMIHFYNPCRVGPSTPYLWCITVATQASFLYLVRF